MHQVQPSIKLQQQALKSFAFKKQQINKKNQVGYFTTVHTPLVNPIIIYYVKWKGKESSTCT